MLKDLQAGEFIYEQPALGEAEYTFKHVLTQEVAYNSVLMERRRLLHERTGEAIEALFKDRIDDHLAELAHHYSRTANTRKAVEYLFRAGSQAAARYAHSEAVIRLSSALELLKHLPDDAERARQELSVLSALGRSLRNVKGWAAAELEPVYARARELCAQIRDPALAFRALYGQWVMRWWKLSCTSSGTRRRASGRSRGCERPGDAPGRQLRARHYPSFLGELVSANEHLEKALAVFDLRQPLPAELEARRLDFVLPSCTLVCGTWLSRSCLGDIARDAGGGSAVFRSLTFWPGFLLCGLTQLGRVGTAQPRKSTPKRRWRSPKRWDS